ncbi:MAG: glycosyltransferase family 2 protein [Candidatus Ratteibacteria bacterium]|nr:glycosyltransferase family 2 protein [Candidatus Ratteibacteria bacterium]
MQEPLYRSPKSSGTELPDVSIIILTYNGSKYIEALLKSLSSQSYPKEKIEIIVVDNASTDDTLSLVQKSYPNVKHIALARNMGFAAGNNEALKYAKNNFLVFLNQDTICHENWLMGLVNGLLEDKNLGACTSNIISPGTEEFRHLDNHYAINSVYFYDLSPFGYGQYRKKIGSRNLFSKIVSGCSFIIRRQTIEELGYLFDEKLWMYTEDTDLSLRIHNLGYKICVVCNSVVFHMHGFPNKIKLGYFNLISKALMNRVYVFFKNMKGLEFALFSPFLFLGGIFKITEFPLKPLQKAVLFFPFALFSMGCMFIALFHLPEYIADRHYILKKRRTKGFPILKLVFKNTDTQETQPC